MSELNWGGPFWILWCILPIGLGLWWVLQHRTQILRQLSLLKAIRWHRWRSLLLLIYFTGALLAYSRPQIGKESQKVEKSYRDIVVLLDVSRSMLAEDIKPSRMAQARTLDFARCSMEIEWPGAFCRGRFCTNAADDRLYGLQ